MLGWGGQLVPGMEGTQSCRVSVTHKGTSPKMCTTLETWPLSNNLPEAPPPDAITLGHGLSTYTLVGTNIQPMTGNEA